MRISFVLIFLLLFSACKEATPTLESMLGDDSVSNPSVGKLPKGHMVVGALPGEVPTSSYKVRRQRVALIPQAKEATTSSYKVKSYVR